MAVKNPSMLHHKDLENYTTPDASSPVTAGKKQQTHKRTLTGKNNDSWFRLCEVKIISVSTSYYMDHKI